MATRYGRAFGETFYYLSEYIENADQVVEIVRSENKIPVIIDCVDNNKTRFIIKEGLRKYQDIYGDRNTLSLSSGNEEYAGQVVFSYQIADIYNDWTNYRTISPDLIDIFPNMDIDKLPSEESCAEQAVSAPQNIHTNMTAADILFGFVNRLLNNKPIDVSTIFFDSSTMMRKSYSGRDSHIKELLKMVPGNKALKTFFHSEELTAEELEAPSYEDVLSMHKELEVAE